MTVRKLLLSKRKATSNSDYLVSRYPYSPFFLNGRSDCCFVTFMKRCKYD
ncbi:MAG: hypothetical protein RR357_00740 [Clostridia bacterium]